MCYPNWLVREYPPVSAAPSPINGLGLFTNRRFAAGEVIGKLALKKAGTQGVHTIKIGGEHRLVGKPWRYLNHACLPNAVLQSGQDDITVYAMADILPQAEVTIDYRLLEETISARFTCGCGKCRASNAPERL